MLIKVKNYEHYNRSMGKYISSKKQYNEEMRRGGYVTLEEGDFLAGRYNSEKKWQPSEKLRDLLRCMKSMANSKGEITLSDHPKLISAMREMGIDFSGKAQELAYKGEY